MKKLKKLMTLLSCFLFFLYSMNISVVASNVSKNENSQDAAYSAYLNLSENLNIRMDSVSSNYPDTFGGCYIDGNKLVILLTELTPQEKQYYISACENSSDVVFEQVNYSYEYLLDLEEEIVSRVEKNANVYEHYISVATNTVNIGVDDISEDVSWKSRTATPLPILFYEVSSLPETAAMQGGEEITNGSDSFSICFFGKYNSKDSLITCGHTNTVGKSIYYNNTVIGNVIKQNLKLYTDVDGIPASYGDFSIVDISNSSINGSGYVKTPNGSISATGTANLVVGLTVKMYGKTSSCVNGTIKNTSVTATFYEPGTYEQYKVKGLTTVEGATTVASGDSGGCVIYTTSTGVNRIAGCITGYKAGVYSYITPASYIESSGFSFN